MSDSIEVLISEERIRKRIDEIADALVAGMPNGAAEEDVILIGPLKGAIMLMADLGRALQKRGLALSMDFLGLSSYGSGTVSSGKVSLKQDLSMDISGCHILLVDDILDTGHTMAFAQQHLRQHNPRAITTVLLLDKPSRRKVAVPVDHIGFEIPNLFIVGYGADLDQRYRELPYIGLLKS